VPAGRRGRSSVMATTAGSSHFPKEITVGGRPIRTPKKEFGMMFILSKAAKE
jgi:hypothetical protein